MNQQQVQHMFVRDVTIELNNAFVSIHAEGLTNWHTYAIKSLDYISPWETKWPQEKWGDLYKTDENGRISLTIMAVLVTSLQSVKRSQLGISIEEMCSVYEMNHEALKRWKEIELPIEQKISQRLQIMSGVPNNNNMTPGSIMGKA